ncbi:glycosyltransferase [Paraflavitalea soli]|uniref:Glycosyltransferase n=1 Tax=Paraflavitalea soli TaxID=2315862 RepID=A0A3B7MN31_9BACT|nr:glycosyltransferase family 4 protein [Paraflavitalea soli]AXY75548.1 glycosyltransferase [Paraflavitalea soli]
MTILHLVQKPQMRGAEIFAAQLASHTHRNGHRVILVSLFPGTVQLPFDGKTINLGGKKGHRLWNLTAWRKLANIIKQEKPDLIQANAGDTLKYAVFSKLIFRWKQPIIFRNASTISLYIKTWPAKIWNRFLFRHTDKIVSVSKTSATDFAQLFPKCKDKIVIVPIGIEEAPVKRKADLAKQNGHRLSPILVHVGGFTYEKNHIRLIAIYQELQTIYPHARLHLVGDGPLRKDIEEIVKQKGLGFGIRFLGAQKEVMPLIAEADVLLLPSIIEGLPGVILEAFYCKIPVVAYDVGGVGEVLINNDTGHLVRKGDETAFVDAICDVIENKEAESYLVQNAYHLVISAYLNKKIARRFMNVYESVVRHWKEVYHLQKMI